MKRELFFASTGFLKSLLLPKGDANLVSRLRQICLPEMGSRERRVRRTVMRRGEQYMTMNESSTRRNMCDVTWHSENDGDLDPEDPFGTVVITCNDSEVHFNDIFLDSFFLHFCRGLNRLGNSSEVTVDMVDEPTEINLRLDDHNLQISFRGNSLTCQQLNKLRYSFARASKNFLDKLDQSCANAKAPSRELNDLRLFAATILDQGLEN